MRDYNARIGVRIVPSIDSDLSDVATQVTLDAEQLEEYDMSSPKAVRAKPVRRREPAAIDNIT